MTDSKSSTSGEYNALLLAAITEIRDDQRDFRSRIEGKIDTQGGEIKQILVSLADGTGRMNVMQTTIDNVKSNTESHDRRLRSMESGSGLRTAIRQITPNPDEDEKPKGGWIGVDKIPSILMALGSLIAVVISSVALMKTPAPVAASTTATTPTPAAHAP